MSKYTVITHLASRAQQLADGCNLHAKPGQPNSPWEVVGGLRQLTSELVNQIARQEALEEKDRQQLAESRAELRRMNEVRREARNRLEREYGQRARGEI